MYEDNTILSTRFPQKLWRIVSECRTGAIRWSNSGSSLLLDYKKFHDEYLSPENAIFKTSNITSFIRQLNLYGFRKVTSHNRDPMCNLRNPDVHEFLHENFQRDRSHLLPKVCRKTSRKKKHLERAQSRNNNIQPAKRSEFEIYEGQTQGLTRLQMCQFALKKALDEAVEDYRRQRQYKVQNNEINTFTTNHCIFSHTHLRY